VLLVARRPQTTRAREEKGERAPFWTSSSSAGVIHENLRVRAWERQKSSDTHSGRTHLRGERARAAKSNCRGLLSSSADEEGAGGVGVSSE